MITEAITTQTQELQDFMKQCEARGFKNNHTLKALKFQWCLDEGGMWYATYTPSGEMISISGIHPFKDGWRALFRGAQTQTRPVGLNRYHMQSYPFHSQLPLQIEWAKQSDNDPFIYITTNTENDMSGKMTRINKTFMILESHDIVVPLGEENIYSVKQYLWLLNNQVYEDIRKKYE